MKPARTRRFQRIGLQRVVLLILALATFALAGCGSTATLPESVTSELDIPNNPIARLSDNMSEELPRVEMLQATARARELGTELRFVVAGDDDELVNAKAVADRYGGLVLSYKSGSSDFQASANIVQEQLDRAIAAASAEAEMGQSALAFVQVLEEDGGLQPRSNNFLGLPLWLWWLLLGIAIAFVLWQLRSYLRARKRAQRRRDDFHSRREILIDWAERLEPEVNVVRPYYAQLDQTGRTMFEESQGFVSSIVPTLQEATSTDELVAAEIRIARTAMKLRTLRGTVGA